MTSSTLGVAGGKAGRKEGGKDKEEKEGMGAKGVGSNKQRRLQVVASLDVAR